MTFTFGFTFLTPPKHHSDAPALGNKSGGTISGVKTMCYKLIFGNTRGKRRKMHQIGASRALCRGQRPRPAPGPHRRHDGTQPGPGVGPNAPAPGPALRRPSCHPRMARQRQIIMTDSAVSRPVTARTARRPGGRGRFLARKCAPGWA